MPLASSRVWEVVLCLVAEAGEAEGVKETAIVSDLDSVVWTAEELETAELPAREAVLAR